MKAKDITQDEINYLNGMLEYKDGELVYKIKRGKREAGDVAGSINARNYKRVYVSRNGARKSYAVHRVVMLLSTGEWPDIVDHIDGNTLNNNISNLRSTNLSGNAHNRAINSNSSSGVKGVCWHKQRLKWRAQIRIGKIKKHLGYFDDIDDARCAVESARCILHKDFANHG